MCRNDVFKRLEKKDRRLIKGLDLLTSEQVYGSNSHRKRVEVAIEAYEEVRKVLRPYAKNPHIGKKMVEYAIAHALWHAVNKSKDNLGKLHKTLEAVGITLHNKDFIPEFDNVVGLFRPKKGKINPVLVT